MSTSTLATAEREAILEKLLAEERTDLAFRLQKCGRPLRLLCQCCQRPRDVLTRCDLKWCPSCQRALAARTADRYARISGALQWPLFVTWTVQHDRDDPVDLIRHVRRSHTKLRRLRWFKRAIKGGVIAYEVTHGENGWHPHGHSLIDCKWLAVTIGAPQRRASRNEWQRRGKIAAKEVGEQWSLALGRRGSVKVRRCWTDSSGGIGGAVHEVLKYSVKGSDLAKLEVPIAPLIDVLDRTRLVASWGSMYRHPAVKRQRGAPGMCECGSSDWLPEEVAMDQLTRARRRR